MTVALKAIEVNGSILGKVNALSLIVSLEMSSLPRVRFSWSFFYLFKKHSFTQRQFGSEAGK